MAETSIDTRVVKRLAEILDEKSLTEIEYESDDCRIRISRETIGVSYAPAPAQAIAPAPAPVAAVAPVANVAVAPVVDNYENHPGAVKSPMVGVLYASAEPGAAPYVKEGDTVTAGQTLFLVEAMKTFNPVKAPKSGKVTKIIAQDGMPVEFDEPLLILE